ncbi:MAG: hypothetical protein D6731_15110 [Planctomycetota bacterium]|nr:MAG: hypothetical protein D6731_15110 [Planctomycetota bacterium]
MTALFVVILWLCFRDPRALWVPLLAVLLATLYTAGLLGLVGEPINIINNVLPVLIFVIAMSDAIHVIARYRRELAAGRPQREALWTTLRHLAVACLLTSLTTAVGFASLATADIGILRRFGLTAAAGVGLAYVVTIAFVPLAFSVLSPRLGQEPQRVDALFDRLSLRLGRWVLRRRGRVLAGALLCTAIAIALGARVRIDNNVYEAFDPDDPFALANARLERDFGGIVSLSLVVAWEADASGPLTPEALAYLSELEDFLRARGVLPLSVADLVAEGNAALRRGDPAARRVPETPEACRAAFLAVSAALETTGRGEALRRLWSSPRRWTRIVGQVGDLGSTRLNGIFAAIEERLARDRARHTELGLRCFLSGDGPVASRGVDRLIGDLFVSLLTAFAFIVPVLCLLFRSLRAGLVSTIPNLLPLIATLGFLGATGRELRVTSVIVFSISLGLAVDDTIHFMVRFGEEWRRAGVGRTAYARALLRTYRGAGSAIILTTLLLTAGFSALLLSDFPISRSFALCMEVTIVAALLGDLLVLPAVLAVFRPFGAAPEVPADFDPAAPGAEGAEQS